MRPSLCFFFYFAAVTFTAHFLNPQSALAGDEKKPGLFSGLFGDRDAEQLDEWRKPETLKRQLADLRRRIGDLNDDLKTTDDEDDADDIEDLLEILEFTENWAAQTLSHSPSAKEIFSANTQIHRILAGVDEPVGGQKFPGPFAIFNNFVIGGLIGHPMPLLSPKQQNRQLGSRLARREATYLYKPETGSFYSADELAALTPEEVSLLDVSPDHPAWYREDQLARIRSSRLRQFDGWLEDGINAKLREGGDLKNGQRWNLHTARKVLFIEDVYMSATSPKGTAEDAFGVEWKFKWGDETHIEPVASRLYLLAGAKITDGNFVNGSGPDSLVLVLAKPGEYDPEDEEEREPETLEQMQEVLTDFYGFDLTPYLHSHGTITAANAGEILRHLPEGGKKKYRKKNVIGRQWVSFRESMVELKPKGFVRRFEASRMSDLAARNDRAARGNFLFSMWIANRDVKDDNNKSYFIKQPVGSGGKMRITGYQEGHHDMGMSLGSLFSAGNVNKIETGSAFARTNLFGSKIRFPKAIAFKPEAWNETTWADSKWMARKIASLSETEIAKAVAYSQWPDFAQAALVYKLTDRRNRIAELFGLTGQLERYPAAAPTLVVPLGSAAEIRNAETHYRLSPGSLQAELAAIGAGPGYSETLLSAGQIAACDDSAVIRLLVNQRFPSGLDSRYQRFGDSQPACLETE